MKRGVVVVNTARGAVMDEGALVEALESGQVASAGLDVYEEEPKVHPGLIANPHVMLVPHMGTWTKEVRSILINFHFRSGKHFWVFSLPFPSSHRAGSVSLGIGRFCSRRSRPLVRDEANETTARYATVPHIERGGTVSRSLARSLSPRKEGRDGTRFWIYPFRVHVGRDKTLKKTPRLKIVLALTIRFSAQTQDAMEKWTIGNVRAALEKGKLNSIVPEQADMQA